MVELWLGWGFDNYEVQRNENNKVLERLFDVVEKNSERLRQLEQKR